MVNAGADSGEIRRDGFGSSLRNNALVAQNNYSIRSIMHALIRTIADIILMMPASLMALLPDAETRKYLAEHVLGVHRAGDA